MAPVLGYWKIRAFAQPIRLLLAYCGADFEDKYYLTGPAPEFSKDSWRSIKHTFGLDFPDLPYYIDGDIKITQAAAILRHIGRKYNLCGATEQEKAKVDVIFAHAMEFRDAFCMMCYVTYNEKYDDYCNGLPARLEMFSNYLADKPYCAGDKITFPDFQLYEVLDQHRILFPGCLDGYKPLQDYMDRFEALPAIKAYIESNRFLKAPINNPQSFFG